MPLHANKPDPVVPDLPKLKITIRDVNPFSAVGAIMKIPINVLAVVFSGLVCHPFTSRIFLILDAAVRRAIQSELYRR